MIIPCKKSSKDLLFQRSYKDFCKHLYVSILILNFIYVFELVLELHLLSNHTPCMYFFRGLFIFNFFYGRLCFLVKRNLLMKRLLELSSDEKIPDEIILEFKRQDVESIAE